MSLAQGAEQHYSNDPNVALYKLRQFGEAIARHVAALAGIDAQMIRQAELLVELQRRGMLDRDVANMLHALRKEGNAAVHDFAGSQREALNGLRLARQVAIWFHRAFGRPADSFKPGAFVEPVSINYAERATRLERELAERDQLIAWRPTITLSAQRQLS